MAEIPVAKKAGIPWWVWLIPALLIALLLWWILDDDDEVEQVPVAGYEQSVDPADLNAIAVVPVVPADNVSAGNPASGPITDLAAVRGAGNVGEIAGRPVELNGVPVLEMVSDAGFYIGSSEADRVYVLLNEQETPNTPIEGRVDVNKGQTIGLSGTVKAASEGVPTGLVLPKGVDRYIWAQSVTIR